MPRGGPRPGSGRPKGSKSQTQVRRELGQFTQTIKAAAAPGAVITAETFDGFSHMCTIAMLSINQVVDQRKLIGTPDFKPEFYAMCLRDARVAAEAVTRYQRPTMRAIAIMEHPRTGELPVLALPSNVVEFPVDQVSAAKAYQRMISAGRVANG